MEDSGLFDSHLNTVEGKVFLVYMAKFAKTYSLIIILSILNHFYQVYQVKMHKNFPSHSC